MVISGSKVKSWLGFFEILWWHNCIGPDGLVKWQHLQGWIPSWKIVTQCVPSLFWWLMYQELNSIFMWIIFIHKRSFTKKCLKCYYIYHSQIMARQKWQPLSFNFESFIEGLRYPHAGGWSSEGKYLLAQNASVFGISVSDVSQLYVLYWPTSFMSRCTIPSHSLPVMPISVTKYKTNSHICHTVSLCALSKGACPICFPAVFDRWITPAAKDSRWPFQLTWDHSNALTYEY